jgi:hypothetical protein
MGTMLHDLSRNLHVKFHVIHNPDPSCRSFVFGKGGGGRMTFTTQILSHLSICIVYPWLAFITVYIIV